VYIEQDYSAYTEAHHRTWATLFERRMATLPDQACAAFLRGLDIIGFDPMHMPRIGDVNAKLEPLTGWQAAPVGGYLPAKEFFTSLSQRKFPTTISIRPEDQLDYLPEPDMFHDVFGHVPMHTDPVFADFLQKFGELGMGDLSEEERTRLARLFWFTVEFGLISEDGRIKIYGSGLCSSPGEGAYALTDAVEKLPFDAERVMNQPFEIDHYQPLLFVVDSFEQVYEALEEQLGRLAALQ
jgi:phenylalanine-4-hydroxylase